MARLPAARTERDPTRRRRALRIVYWALILLKGVDGALEMIGGVLLASLGRARIHSLVWLLTQHELAEDPRDFIANHLRDLAHHLTHAQRLFAALYLLVHGAIKVGLVAALWRGRAWAYPVAIVFLLGFAGYEVYRYTYSQSVVFVGLAVLDVLIAWSVWEVHRRRPRDGRD